MFDPAVEYQLIVQWLDKLVDTYITPKSFVQRLGIFLNRRHKIQVKLLDYKNSSLDPGDFTFGGIYECTLDKQRKKAIVLYFVVNHQKMEQWFITRQRAYEIAADLIETISHEYRHQYQYRSRKFLSSDVYKSQEVDTDLRAEQEYLGSSDEIDAYAYNIAVKQVLGIGPSRDVDVYVKAFGSDHPVVRKLRKKIVKNLNNLKLKKIGLKTRRLTPAHNKR